MGPLMEMAKCGMNLVNSASNYPHRPHALTGWKTRHSIFQGIRFVQSQMWYAENEGDPIGRLHG